MIKRMHVAVNCSDLQKSIDFYSAFFGVEPTKVKENYAKFELNDPALHFSLNVRPFEPRGVLNHLGFQLNNTEEVLAIGDRLRESGLLLIDEMNTTCCYAVQDKVWVHDPDGNAWEIFFTKEDSEFEHAGELREVSSCCVPTGLQTITFGSFKKVEC
ncbi:catechol 2,3-dioxygenase-like lactoylglutathione lyase family enzyme [Paenibacillus taihuensis]|uniref:Catechol 2,3-dioxygenase-like lactoylglutathione lyase family enzyme n=1 Tax=Paenibacillus taihuensis TaxID=1156355 RepID=A0A3D9S0A7_9BACL|nr:ArsI/CadI family heavy metal resistance metalloenzyme [Paenibacillus taihuensis]REE85158.1 catechol 2,3-dioxygenase-like lactoylglutathione lyase family enzyme [Paenibacillus taihuensis]